MYNKDAILSANVKPGELPERERWSSRAAFYFAAIGSAVGFSNVWRFPSLVYKYGGAAFFVPYLLALVFIGMPVLMLEISLGQYYETGDVGVFGGIHERLRGVGLASIACGYMLVTYYSMLLSWVARAFVDSCGPENIWTNGVTEVEAKDHFMNNIIGMETLDLDDPRPTRVVWDNIGYSLFVWIVVYLCIVFGIKWTGRITYFTMGFPVVLLFLMLWKALSLEANHEGIGQYLSSDWSVLVDQPQVWSEAVSQTFFSIGLCFGIMTAYGSHCGRDEPAFLNSVVIAVSNSLYSFIAGFTVFATLGHLAYAGGTTIGNLDIHGVGLIFVSWPVALGNLPGGEHWIRLLFFMLFCLGIDSAFAFMEGFVICFSNTVLFGRVDKRFTSLGIAFVGWLLSFLYATDAGLIFLDTIDYYINFIMLLVALAECFVAGWIYNLDEQIDNLGAWIVFSFMATTFGSVFLACILWIGIDDPDIALVAGFIGLLASFALGMTFVCFLMHTKMRECRGLWSWKSMFYDLAFRNVLDLREDLSGVVGYIPIVWAVLIKFFIPPVLVVLFCVGCAAETTTGETEFGHYEDYPALPFQTLGLLTVGFAGFLLVSSILVPQMYEAFQKQNSYGETVLGAAQKRRSFSGTSSAASSMLHMHEQEHPADQPADFHRTEQQESRVLAPATNGESTPLPSPPAPGADKFPSSLHSLPSVDNVPSPSASAPPSERSPRPLHFNPQNDGGHAPRDHNSDTESYLEEGSSATDEMESLHTADGIEIVDGSSVITSSSDEETLLSIVTEEQMLNVMRALKSNVDNV